MLCVDTGVPDLNDLLHRSRQDHVKLFFDTQTAATTQEETTKKINKLHVTLERFDPTHGVL